MLFATISTKATVWTVSNDANQPAQFSNLQIACDSASAGDTLYVQGTPTDYGSVSIKKQLHIIGAGIKPSGNFLYGYPTAISTIILDTVSYISGASGTIIEGVTNNSTLTTYTGCKNIILKRNKFAGSYRKFNSCTNILIYNNIFTAGYLRLSSATNIIIMNNIFSSSYIENGGTTISISNNVFLNSIAFSSCNSSTISNNIFYYAAVTSTDYCSFSNNIGFGIATNIVQGTNTGSGNLTSDPKFTYIYSTTDHSFNDNNKYSTQTTSPANNAGTDATDIGIYGGQYPWPESNIAAYMHLISPTMPVVQELNIQNSSVPANGTLNFSVKAIKTAK